MDFKIYRFEIYQEAFGAKEGFLLQGEKGWSEVSPLPGRSRETLDEALQQLRAIQQGYQGPLLPSVAFGLFGLTAPKIPHAPVCLFLRGAPQEILKQAKQNHGCRTAKVKLGSFDLSTALFLVKTLKQDFHLRIDLGGHWSQEKVSSFCSHFEPHDFEFIEDPGHDISPFHMAADSAELGSIRVWKPMVKGMPSKQAAVILSSSYESGIGIHQIASLARALEIPPHPLGIGTFIHLQSDLLQEPLVIKDGEIHFPPEFLLKKERLTLC
jgi:O-succinylbenzoate synthase